MTHRASSPKGRRPQATISDLETGKSRRIELDLLDNLAKALRCKPGDLIVKRGKRH